MLSPNGQDLPGPETILDLLVGACSICWASLAMSRKGSWHCSLRQTSKQSSTLGGFPTEDEELSADQLATLHSLFKFGRTPYTDMGALSTQAAKEDEDARHALCSQWGHHACGDAWSYGL